MPGLFVVLEGLDRAGKSTQARLLQKYWEEQGIKVKLYTFPNRSTATGQKIHAHLIGLDAITSEELHQLFSNNRRESAQAMEQDLMEGTNIIADRYLFSGVAYSMVRGLDIDWCLTSEKGLLLPDIVLFLSCTSASTRAGYGQELYEQDKFQQEVAKAFTQVQQRFAHLWWEINADGSVDEVHRSMSDKVTKLLPSVPRRY